MGIGLGLLASSSHGLMAEHQVIGMVHAPAAIHFRALIWHAWLMIISTTYFLT